jgi:glycosidase
MPGAGDPDNRRMMVFDGLNDKQKKLKETVAALFALRTSHLSLMYGGTEVYAKGDIMIIQRSYFSEKVIFVFNKSKQPQTIETGSNIGSYTPQFGHKANGNTVELPPLSFEVFVGRK